ncbi:MAG: hypothetical protein J7M13_08200 [Synergistetes bacterium]|nr:hypothetical protein [Synergistota bacterium]
MFLKRVSVVAFIFLLVGISTPVLSAEIMPLKDIKPGMVGYVKTVFKGTRIESFPVRVISVIKSSKGDRHFILVRAYGPLIERIGGIAAGMSGSPLYIRGKIAGAIGYGWRMSDHHLGLVTPIEEMLRVWKWRHRILPPKYKVVLKEVKEKKKKTVMFASGLSPRGLSVLRTDFSEYGVRVMSFPSPGGIKLAKRVKLEPGSAIGALLSCGDISIGAIGTLSYIDGDRFLAFAHPFLLRGSVNYFLTTAYIHECISSIDFPFKLGSPGEIIGMVSQDRVEAIGGFIKHYPLSIPISFVVRSLDDGRERRSFVRVVYDDGILEKLLKVVFLSTFDLGWGKVGEGTVKLHYMIRGKNMPYPLDRTNYFYSEKDASKEAFDAFKEALFTVLDNEFEDVFPIGITVEADFTSFPRILWIKGLKPVSKEIERGKELSVTLTLLPHRGSPVEKRVKVRVPKTFPGGRALLIARGGGICPGGKGNKGQEEPKTYKSLKELLDDFKKTETNNQVIVEVVPMEEGPSKSKKGKKEREAKIVFNTDFYVEGYIEKEVSVK